MLMDTVIRWPKENGEVDACGKVGKFCTTFSIPDIEPCTARINIDKTALVRNTITQGKTLKNGG
jgi:hypothetical protein